MSALRAVCINCGTFKARALVKCEHCGVKPSSAEDEARSLMLALQFEANGELVGLPERQLAAAARCIQAGEGYNFESSEVAKVIAMHARARAVTTRRLALDLVRWLSAPVLVGVAAYWLLWRS